MKVHWSLAAVTAATIVLAVVEWERLQMAVCDGPAGATTPHAEGTLSAVGSDAALNAHGGLTTADALPAMAVAQGEEQFPDCPFAVNTSTYVALGLTDVHRTRHDVAHPEVCITFLSCRRYKYLAQTMHAAVEFMELNPANISYEIAHFDNYQHVNCSRYVKQQFVEKYQVEKYGSATRNHGLSFGHNVLQLGLCRAPFVLALEEDFVISKDCPLLKQGMEILREDPTLVGVYVRADNCHMGSPNDTFGVSKSGVRYRRYHGDWHMFNYAAAGIVLNRTVLQRLGPQREDTKDADGESEFKVRCKANNVTSAWIVYNATTLSDKQCYGCVLHIGATKASKTDGRPGR